MLRVTVGGVDFLGSGGGGFVLSPDGFGGWDDGVGVRLENVARPGAHGAHDLPSYMEPRTVALAGAVLADSSSGLRDLRNRLMGVLAGGVTGRVQVERGGVVEWADCKLASQPRFTEFGGSNAASFQLQLWCPDPRKYGNSKTFVLDAGATVQVHHRGNYGAMPKFIIRGDAPSYTLTINGWNYAVSKALQTGKPHRIDYANGKLYVNGTLTQNSLGNTNVTTIPPGASVGCGLFLTAGGTGSADMTVTDTYI